MASRRGFTIALALRLGAATLLVLAGWAPMTASAAVLFVLRRRTRGER